MILGSDIALIGKQSSGSLSGGSVSVATLVAQGSGKEGMSSASLGDCLGLQAAKCAVVTAGSWIGILIFRCPAVGGWPCFHVCLF